MSVAFYILAALCVAGAVCAMVVRNLVYAVFSMIFFFFSLAGIYVLLSAEFVAAAQVLVYVGGVGILVLFAIMLTRDVTGEGKRHMASKGAWLGGLVAAAVPVALFIPAVWRTPLPGSPAEAAVRATPVEIGMALMGPGVPALWLVAVLLTAALIGAVVIATQDRPERGDGEGPAR